MMNAVSSSGGSLSRRSASSIIDSQNGDRRSTGTATVPLGTAGLSADSSLDEVSGVHADAHNREASTMAVHIVRRGGVLIDTSVAGPEDLRGAWLRRDPAALDTLAP